MKVQLYTRPQCSLCVDAKVILEIVQSDVAFEIEEINIEDDETLLEQYMLRIPVIVFEGQIVQEGIIDYPTALEVLIKNN